MEFNVNGLLQLVAIVGGFLGVWIRTQMKLKELDLRLATLEFRLNSVEKIDEKIWDKLTDISDAINELKIEINNKQNKL